LAAPSRCAGRVLPRTRGCFRWHCRGWPGCRPAPSRRRSARGLPHRDPRAARARVGARGRLQ
jgi:hypothetical protein